MAFVFSGVRVFDGSQWAPEPLDVVVDGDTIAGTGSAGSARWTHRIEGGVLICGFVDAHVHLAFADPLEVARGGVTGVLDMGSPLPFALSEHPPVRYRFSGPMLTSPGGYPTRSWGAEGFGLEVGTVEHSAQATSELIDHGAAVVKVVLEPREGDMLHPSRLRAIVDTAHARGVRVAAHALVLEAVEAAVECGVDVLAHAPVDALPDEVVQRLASRASIVIPTLRRVDGARAAIDNVRRLAEAGCTVAYGSDLGADGVPPGVDVSELRLVAEALGSDEAALRAATSAAGWVAGIRSGIEPGVPADLIWLPAYDSLEDLAGPKRVWIAGTEVAD